MLKKIYFDLDGTVYDLYGQPNWLQKIKAEDEEIYTTGKLLIDLNMLKEVCNLLSNKGFIFGVLTWGAKGSSQQFFNRTAKIKRQWVRNNMPFVDEIHVMQYGVDKQRRVPHGVKNNIVYLIDDNKEVLDKWCGRSINANGDIIIELQKLLAI